MDDGQLLPWPQPSTEPGLSAFTHTGSVTSLGEPDLKWTHQTLVACLNPAHVLR